MNLHESIELVFRFSIGVQQPTVIGDGRQILFRRDTNTFSVIQLDGDSLAVMDVLDLGTR